VASAVAEWLRAHSDQSVREIFVDLTDVDYRWGDAPVLSLLPFIQQGVQQIRFRASASSAPALESLLAATRLPWFSVERVDG
jgi:hypothetical protein